MAVVTGKSDLISDYLDPNSYPPDTQFMRGRLIIATGTVINASTDNAGSKYKLCPVPADAILDERTALQVQNWGFATVNIGTKSDPTAILSVARSAANVQNPVAFGDANHGKRLWERLGLAASPGGDIMLYVTGPADATAAGTLKFSIAYRYRT